MSSSHHHGSPFNSPAMDKTKLLLAPSSDELETRPVIQRFGSILEDAKTFSPIVVSAFTINFIFGAGVLGIPFAFTQAGILASCVLLIIVTVLSIITMTWEVEVCARAEGWVQYEELREFMEDPPEPSFEIARRRFEVNELAHIFLGSLGRRVYELSVLLYITSACWFYGVIVARSLAQTVPLPALNNVYCSFAGSLESLAPHCREAYVTHLLIFAAIMAVVLCFELGETAKLQASLTLFGLFSVALILATTTYGLATGPYNSSAVMAPGSHLARVELLLDVDGFGDSFCTFMFAQLAHHGVPGLTSLLEDKQRSTRVWAASLSTTAAVYLLIGTLCGLYMGSGTQAIVTLNWATGPLSQGSTVLIVASYAIRLFPVVTIFAAFPLNITTLAASLRHSLPTSFREKCRPRLLAIVARWVCTVLPLCGAMYMDNVTTILNVCGIFAILIVMVMPAALQIASRRAVSKRWASHDGLTPYSTMFSDTFYCYLVFIFALVALGFAIIKLIPH